MIDSQNGKKMQWFRLYAEFSIDHKVQMMSEVNQRRLVMLFCSRCNGDVTLHDEEMAFFLRISGDEWAATKAEFIKRGFINSENEVLNWGSRQYESDKSNQRVKKHREKMKRSGNGECNVTVTPPETEADTDTEKKDTVAYAREPENVSHETAATDPSEVFTLGEKIAEVVGWKDDPRWMGNYSRLGAWLERGFDFELDILPTVQRLTAKKTGTRPTSLAYFEQAIADAHASRIAPVPQGQPRASPRQTGKKSFSRGIMEESARAVQRMRGGQE